MATLVNNLLQFSRRGHRQVSTVDVCEELWNSTEFVHYHLRQRTIAVEREFAGAVPTIQADRQQLRQLFLNLLTNAADAMPQGGVITLRVSAAKYRDDADAVVIEVVDAGEGIPPDNLHKVWEPFFTTKPEGRGTGLGLAICRRIVEEHGGTIEIESEPAKGTTVRIKLPATSNGEATHLL
jgi:signal transduction histidine kinase